MQVIELVVAFMDVIRTRVMFSSRLLAKDNKLIHLVYMFLTIMSSFVLKDAGRYSYSNAPLGKPLKKEQKN